MKPFEVSHLKCFAWKCQINYSLFTWWRVMLIKGHMNNGRRCRCNASLGQTNGLILLQSNVSSRTQTGKRLSVSGGKGKHSFAEHSRFFIIIFFFTLLVYLFVFLLIVSSFGMKRVALMPFFPLDVSINQHLHHQPVEGKKQKKISAGQWREYWPESHILILSLRKIIKQYEIL